MKFFTYLILAASATAVVIQPQHQTRNRVASQEVPPTVGPAPEVLPKLARDSSSSGDGASANNSTVVAARDAGNATTVEAREESNSTAAAVRRDSGSSNNTARSVRRDGMARLFW